jgi:peptidoglycan/LPS O-acetylase OafA/YrhL
VAEVHVARSADGTRLVGLDGLRFAAAAGIMLYHFTARWSQVWGRPPEEVFPWFGRVISYAVLGPEQFFVISGFVILLTAWGRDVPHVVASRVARLFPAYWAAVLLTSFLLLVLWRDGKRISLGEAAVNLTMLQSLFGVRHVDGVYWTLWVELRFYLLIVLLVVVGLTRGRLLLVCAAWPPLAILTERAGLEPFATALLGGYAPLFAGGMVLYLIYREGHGPLPWSVVALNIVLAVHESAPRAFASLVRNTGFEPSTPLLGLGVVGCFVTVAVLTLTPLRAWGARWLVVVASLTYPLYLVHEFWGWWVIKLAHASLGAWPTVVMATVVVLAMATAIHYGIERPIGPLLRRWLEDALRPGAGGVTRVGNARQGKRPDPRSHRLGSRR